MPTNYEGLVKDLYGTTKLQPRPYQLRIVQTAIECFTGNKVDRGGSLIPKCRSTLIESATGSGKTSMCLMAARGMQQFEGGDIAWVAMRRNLLEQAANENHRLNIGAKDVHYISMFEREIPSHLLPENRSKPLTLVCDEAQHDAASSMAHMHDVLKPEYVIGCTATPFRVDGVKLCFDYTIRDAGIHQLMMDGYLSQYDHYTVKKYSPESYAQHYLMDPDKWGKSIFYFHKVEECEEFASVLRAAGVKMEIVIGGSMSVREGQLDKFRSGEINVLANCMVLTEGFDCPDLETVWCRDSSRGTTIQMCGRAFRPHVDFARHGHDAPKYKKVVQSVETRYPMQRTAHPKHSFVHENGQWLSLEVNPMIEDVFENVQDMIASSEVNLPSYIKPAKKRTKRYV